MKQLIEYIEQFVKLDANAIKALEERTRIEEFNKGEHMLKVGAYCNKLWFLKSGLVRKYHYNDGNEITCWVHAEREIFTSLESFSKQRSSTENIQAIEPTEVISITRENAQLLSSIPQLQNFSSLMMQRAFADIDTHTKAFSAADAKGKYEYLKVIAPEAVKRAKLGYVASILGISQETLSRIRKV